jgi:hypothetical protein
MSREWIAEELETADLGDQRLNDRLTEVLGALSERPNVSIPAACGGYAETVAAYRFFDNEKTTFEKIIKPHYKMTQERIASHEVVLFVQDSSTIDLTKPEQQVQGAGPVGDGKNRRGAILHLLEALTPDNVVLGAVWSKIMIRSELNEQEQLERATRTKAEKKKIKRLKSKRPVEDKESFRWIEGYRETNKIAGLHPQTTCVCIGDSESDFFEIFAEPRENNAHILVRACYDRRCSTDEYDTSTHLRDAVSREAVVGTSAVFVRARQPAVSCTRQPRQQVRKSRNAELEIRAKTVTIEPPSRLCRQYESVPLNVVLVSEPNPPEGEPAIEWILLTTLPISTWEEISAIIKYYSSRWMIEMFFKTLKSGCGVEKLRFETMERLLPCLAVYLIVAWRVLMICHLGRVEMEMSCEIVFDPAEWKATYRVMHPKKKLPSKPPTLHAMLRLVGELGGWVSTPRRKDMPGPQTTWIGLQRVRDLAWAWKMFGPEAEKYKKDV